MVPALQPRPSLELKSCQQREPCWASASPRHGFPGDAEEDRRPAFTQHNSRPKERPPGWTTRAQRAKAVRRVAGPVAKPGLEPRGEPYHFLGGGLFADRLRVFLAHPGAGGAPHPHVVHQNGPAGDGEAKFLPIPGGGNQDFLWLPRGRGPRGGAGDGCVVPLTYWQRRHQSPHGCRSRRGPGSPWPST